uniref:Transcriptional regulatory protein SEF1 n=1 Tax=Ganoderma boninense TaxID=34458 RepID=A0A5K1JW45_9APHY|nr:Transcriptional regulatory protein SEF1 [Ganoderma boninense]
MFENVSDGGLIPPAEDHTMDMFVPHLLFGYACILSMFLLLAYYDSSQMPELAVLTHISEVMCALSVGFALSILAVRVCALYKNKYLSLVMQLMALAWWSITLFNMQDIAQRGVPRSHIVSHAAMAIMVAAIPTSTLLLTLFYVLVVAKHEHNFRVRDCLWMLWNVDVPELALISIITVPCTVFFILDVFDSATYHLALDFAAFMTTTITAARIYRKMLRRLDACPVNLCPIEAYRWLKQSALFMAGKVGLKPKPHLIASNQAHPSGGIPPLGSQRASQSVTLSMLSARQRQANNRVCVPAHSRSTYAHSSLYDSQAS